MGVSLSAEISELSCLNMIIHSHKTRDEFLNFIFLDSNQGINDIVVLLTEIERIHESDPESFLPQISLLVREDTRFKDIDLTEVENFIMTKFSSFLYSQGYYEICECSLELNTQVEGREDRLIRLQKNFSVKSSAMVKDIMHSIDLSNCFCNKNGGFPLESSSAIIEEWFPYFISMFELLPVSVSLIANHKDKDYPITYVNKAYEKVSGYSKREVMSQPSMEYMRGRHKNIAANTNVSWGNYMRSLLPSKTNTSSENKEKEQSLLMAIQYGIPVRMNNVTCYHKNGRSYQSVIAMKPIFTTHSEYVFTLCCQVDTSKMFNKNVQSFNSLFSIHYVTKHCRKIR